MIKSRRYCVTCKKITTFKLKKNCKNKLLKHSKCSECGNIFAISKRHAKQVGYIGGKKNGI